MSTYWIAWRGKRAVAFWDTESITRDAFQAEHPGHEITEVGPGKSLIELTHERELEDRT